MSISIKKLFMTKKVVAIAAAGALTLGVGGAAFAYFTSAGAGTGAATTGSTTAFTIAEDGTAATLYPGSAAVAVPYTITNPGSGNQYVNTVTTAVAQDSNGNVLSSAAGNAPIVGCLATWFQVNNATQAVKQDIAAGQTYDWTTLVGNTTTIQMLDATAIQDSCKNQSIDLTFTSN